MTAFLATVLLLAQAWTHGVPGSATFTVDLNTPNPSSFLGWVVELGSDSITNVVGHDNNDYTSVPHSLTGSGEVTRLGANVLTVGANSFQYIRFAGGLYYRGLRNLNGSSGFAENVKERWPNGTVAANQNTEIQNLIAASGIIAQGGGLYVQHWSPAPHWKTSSACGVGSYGGSPLWAGGANARTVTLESIRLSDPTQYNTQVGLVAAALVNDYEYIHANVAPVKIIGIQNEPGSIAACYGTNVYPSNAVMYLDVFKATIALVKASVTGLQNALITADSWQGIGRSYGAAIHADPTADAYVDMWMYHWISNIADDANFIKNTLVSESAASGAKGSGTDEVWNVNTTDSEGYRFANTALTAINAIGLTNARIHNLMIHLGKPTTADSDIIDGYPLVVYRATGAPTPAAPYASLAEGFWTYNDRNWNAAKGYVKNIPVGSVKYPVAQGATVLNQRVLAMKKPNGKWVLNAVNRLGLPFRSTIAMSGLTSTFACESYSATTRDVPESSLTFVAGSASIVLSPWTNQFCVEQ